MKWSVQDAALAPKDETAATRLPVVSQRRLALLGSFRKGAFRIDTGKVERSLEAVDFALGELDRAADARRRD